MRTTKRSLHTFWRFGQAIKWLYCRRSFCFVLLSSRDVSLFFLVSARAAWAQREYNRSCYGRRKQTNRRQENPFVCCADISPNRGITFQGRNHDDKLDNQTNQKNNPTSTTSGNKGQNWTVTEKAVRELSTFQLYPTMPDFKGNCL